MRAWVQSQTYVKKKKKKNPGMMAHIFNPSAREQKQDSWVLWPASLAESVSLEI